MDCTTFWRITKKEQTRAETTESTGSDTSKVNERKIAYIYTHDYV